MENDLIQAYDRRKNSDLLRARVANKVLKERIYPPPLHSPKRVPDHSSSLIIHPSSEQASQLPCLSYVHARN